MNKKLIVTLTTWTQRIGNIPVVLDSIYAQTIQPDGVVLNLSLKDFPRAENSLPQVVNDYLKEHNVQVVWHEKNKRVYKKLLPTIDLYPNDLILAIDDDFAYPNTMIADFMSVHNQYPDDPISGNKVWWKGLKAHCGCASLVQAKHFEGWHEYDNKAFRIACRADDIFYTYLAAKNGYFYRETKEAYNDNMYSYNPVSPHLKMFGDTNKASSMAVWKAFGYKVIRHFIDADPNKPYCVLGSARTERGKKIEEEMVEWLKPNFNLYVVRHDGSTFEYIAIAFMRMMCLRLRKPFFYLHTKGAYYKRPCSPVVRRMWEYEFTEKQKIYTDIVNQDKAIVACPYTGKENVTWYNGFAMSVKACEQMDFIKTKDRFFYEYGMFKNVEVFGVRYGNIDSQKETKTIMHVDLYKYFSK